MYGTSKFFFLLGGTKYNIIFSYFGKFQFFGPLRTIFPDGGSSSWLIAASDIFLEKISKIKLRGFYTKSSAEWGDLYV